MIVDVFASLGLYVFGKMDIVFVFDQTKGMSVWLVKFVHPLPNQAIVSGWPFEFPVIAPAPPQSTYTPTNTVPAMLGIGGFSAQISQSIVESAQCEFNPIDYDSSYNTLNSSVYSKADFPLGIAYRGGNQYDPKAPPLYLGMGVKLTSNDWGAGFAMGPFTVPITPSIPAMPKHVYLSDHFPKTTQTALGKLCTVTDVTSIYNGGKYAGLSFPYPIYKIGDLSGIPLQMVNLSTPSSAYTMLAVRVGFDVGQIKSYVDPAGNKRNAWAWDVAKANIGVTGVF